METYLDEKLYDVKKENDSVTYKLKPIFGDALEKYFPNQVILENENIKMVVWNMNNKVGRIDDLPSVVIYKKINDKWIVVQEKWMIGVEGSDTMIYHRDQSGETWRGKGKPAFIEYDQYGMDKAHKWFKNGKLHRDNDEPAVMIFHDPERLRKTLIWYQNGEEKRDGDKHTRFIEHWKDRNGTLSWYNKDTLVLVKTFEMIGSSFDIYQHSFDDNPSQVEYYENGNRKLEQWIEDNGLPRKNGPDAIEYYENGNIKHKKFLSSMSISGAKLYIEIDYDENGKMIGK